MTHCYDEAKVKALREAALSNGYPLVRVRSRGKVPVSYDWPKGEATRSLLEVTPGRREHWHALPQLCSC
jgi:hypothetical protein